MWRVRRLSGEALWTLYLLSGSGVYLSVSYNALSLQDSPQFGGPGVKKQSCLERRCLRVLENRLQRDAPTFKGIFMIV